MQLKSSRYNEILYWIYWVGKLESVWYIASFLMNFLSHHWLYSSQVIHNCPIETFIWLCVHFQEYLSYYIGVKINIWNIYKHICHLKCLRHSRTQTEFLLFIVSWVWNKPSLGLVFLPTGLLKSCRLSAVYAWLTSYEIMCCNWFIVEQSGTVIGKPNLEEYFTCALHAKSMHLQTKQLKDGFSKNCIC